MFPLPLCVLIPLCCACMQPIFLCGRGLSICIAPTFWKLSRDEQAQYLTQIRHVQYGNGVAVSSV